MKAIFYRIILICFFIVDVLFLQAQAANSYPQNYFRDPLDIPIQLASNFGELRTDHFHMGLDIRTQSRENLPVHAAASGYVSRIKIEKYGYGRAIYITHPNGYTTLYAHLNKFYDVLENYLEKKQYKDESWEEDFELPENLFTVTKGQFIAYSGNTGGSAGPHLHFEIRDTKTGNNINPLLFGLNIPDKIAPEIFSLYWYDGRYNAYTVSLQPVAISLKNNAYITKSKIVKVNSPIVCFAIRTEDKNNSSPFRFGVYGASLKLDGSLLFEFKLKDFSYDDSRYVNACMDYAEWVKNNKGIQYLFQLPNNQLNIFTNTTSNGKIILNDTLPHKIEINVSDANGNTSHLNFILQYDNSLFADEDYVQQNSVVLTAGKPDTISGTHSKLYFNETAFYDDVPFVLNETPANNSLQISPTIHAASYLIPVHNEYNIAIKRTQDIDDSLKKKVVMQLISGDTRNVESCNWENGYFTSQFDELGNASLLVDTIAPVITQVGWANNSMFTGSKNLIIKCTDDVSRIENFRAELDGKWLLFSKKNDYFIYTFDDHCNAGTHNLSITASDVAGNTTTKNYTFIKQE